MFVDSFQTGTLGNQDNKYIFIIFIDNLQLGIHHFIKTDLHFGFFRGKIKKYLMRTTKKK